MSRKMLKTSERVLLKLPTKAHIEFIGDFVAEEFFGMNFVAPKSSALKFDTNCL